MTSETLKQQIVFAGLYRVRYPIEHTDLEVGDLVLPIIDTDGIVWMQATAYIESPVQFKFEGQTDAGIRQALSFEDPEVGESMLRSIRDYARYVSWYSIETQEDLDMFDFVGDLREWTRIPAADIATRYDADSILFNVRLFRDHGSYWDDVKTGVTIVKVGESAQVQRRINQIQEEFSYPKPSDGVLMMTAEREVTNFKQLPNPTRVEWEYTIKMNDLLAKQEQEIHSLMQERRAAISAAFSNSR